MKDCGRFEIHHLIDVRITLIEEGNLPSEEKFHPQNLRVIFIEFVNIISEEGLIHLEVYLFGLSLEWRKGILFIYDKKWRSFYLCMSSKSDHIRQKW